MNNEALKALTTLVSELIIDHMNKEQAREFLRNVAAAYSDHCDDENVYQKVIEVTS